MSPAGPISSEDSFVAHVTRQPITYLSSHCIKVWSNSLFGGPQSNMSPSNYFMKYFYMITGLLCCNPCDIFGNIKQSFKSTRVNVCHKMLFYRIMRCSVNVSSMPRVGPGILYYVVCHIKHLHFL